MLNIDCMAKRVCFLVYRDWEEVLGEFDDKTFRELITAIFRYGFDREDSELSPMARIAMKLIKPALDRDWDKFSERSEIYRANGAKGGRPKKIKSETDTAGNQLISNIDNSISENQQVSEKPIGFNENLLVSEKPIASINKILNIKNKKQEDNITSENSDNTTSDVNDVLDFYNHTCETCNLTKCRKLTEKRKSNIKSRLRESGKECVFEVISIAAKSDFLNGVNDRGWKADIEFIMNPNKFISIYEGKYNNIKTNPNGSNGSNTEHALESGAKAIQSILFDE